MAKIARSLLTPSLVFLGLVLMATPLALWVAWSDIALFVILASGVAAAVLYCVLVRFEEPAEPGQDNTSESLRAEPLPEDLIEDVQRLHPFIHHHRRSGGRMFRAAMSQLRVQLFRRSD